MSNPTEKSIELALTVQDRLSDIHTRIGDFNRSTGRIFAIYDRYRMILQTDYTNIAFVRKTFRDINEEISERSAGWIDDAWNLGIYQGSETAGIFGFDYDIPPQNEENEIKRSSVNGVQSLIDQQLALFLGLLVAGEKNPTLLFGSGNQWGVLTPRPIITTLKTFTTNVVNSVLSWFSNLTGYGYMAVAILDQKTSPCCRAVDGQVQPMGVPFELTEPPSYADRMIKPPFHDGCRTTRALVSLDEV